MTVLAIPIRGGGHPQAIRTAATAVFPMTAMTAATIRVSADVCVLVLIRLHTRAAV
jgi:hypothetical protein